MSKELNVSLVVGTRPNFIKVAPLINELEKDGFKVKLIHTGQHKDKVMNEIFFDELGIPTPDLYLKGTGETP